MNKVKSIIIVASVLFIGLNFRLTTYAACCPLGHISYTVTSSVDLKWRLNSYHMHYDSISNEWYDCASYDVDYIERRRCNTCSYEENVVCHRIEHQRY